MIETSKALKLCELVIKRDQESKWYYYESEETVFLARMLKVAIEGLDKYTDQSAYKNNRVGDYVPCSIAFRALEEIERICESGE